MALVQSLCEKAGVRPEGTERMVCRSVWGSGGGSGTHLGPCGSRQGTLQGTLQKALYVLHQDLPLQDLLPQGTEVAHIAHSVVATLAGTGAVWCVSFQEGSWL